MRSSFIFRAVLHPITLLLFAVWGFFAFMAPHTFLSRPIYISLMTSVPFVLIASMGMTLTVAAGDMDRSFGSNMAFSGFVFAVVTRESGSAELGMAAGLLVGTILGLINGIVIVAARIPSLVATIGFDFFWRGAVMLLSGGLAVAMPYLRTMTLTSVFAGRIFGVVPAQFLWAVLVSLAAAVILHRTPFGDTLRFIGDNREAARMMGLPVARVRIGVFALLGFLSAFAGILACLELSNWWPTQGEGYPLLVFASVFIGGTSVYGGSGAVWGTFAGTIIISTIEAGVISAGWSGFWTRFVHGLILIVSVAFYSFAEWKKRRE